MSGSAERSASSNATVPSTWRSPPRRPWTAVCGYGRSATSCTRCRRSSAHRTRSRRLPPRWWKSPDSPALVGSRAMTQIETSPLAWLEAHAEQRRQAGLRRILRPRPAVATELDLASNDYLGLSQHPDVIEGGVDALRTWGAGATGSRLVTGNTSLHEELESSLAEFVGAAAGLVFSSGYTANLGAVVGLSGPGSLLVSYALSHASLVDACRLSRARVVVTPHRDIDAVDAALAARDEERAVVITESVFSTDGALAPIRELHVVCRRHRSLLIVDEAHGLGVRGAGGRGLLHELGLAGAPDVVMTTTLSKAFGSQGGAVL